MSAVVSQTTGARIADQRKHQISASLAFVRGIHRWPPSWKKKSSLAAPKVVIMQPVTKISSNWRHFRVNKLRSHTLVRHTFMLKRSLNDHTLIYNKRNLLVSLGIELREKGHQWHGSLPIAEPSWPPGNHHCRGTLRTSGGFVATGTGNIHYRWLKDMVVWGLNIFEISRHLVDHFDWPHLVSKMRFWMTDS